ncbi:helix-turn-helix domain-containing protein [Bifidobacterium adolescentis]|jgi:DNA-binding CsgD family transcriptional regulator|uniref:helix-turn-helix transcriptional regulator n=1 Tax=Bifidobacterium adolescentis TaxID=1680 RepID=UPI0018DE6F76|nr:helix-turn-helix domain-containing protein [Bifidobacterium adolescentis]MBH8620633.1 helix-turn-helix domain-containing protein [Bifidobacterium adolescentis]GDZ08581.1 helix-turn-helix domain-containing protein [Bifidobacteriaceae bacterium MCC01994]GDZ10961.1 helix-turn-helix domain-containing protein [Bifidobacteriaceae bacterium MCC01993]
MSMENVRKLLYHEYGLDPYELRLLMMVADWTGDDGKGFAKSAKTIASQLHMSERTVHNKLRSLREKGFLRYGNQHIVDDIAPNRRPKVYDMHLPKNRGERNAPQEIKPKNRGERNAPQKTGMNQGCNWHESGMNQGCTQRADNTTKSIETIKTIERDPRAKTTTPIPTDWKPTEEHRALADKLGIDCDIEAGKFRDRALDSGTRSADWNAKFRNWLVKGKERGFATPKTGTRRYTWGSEEVKRVLGPIACEGTDTYMELACKVADLLNQGVDPDMLRRQLANVPGDVLAEQLFEQEAAA